MPLPHFRLTTFAAKINMHSHHITVTKTARYYTLGSLGPEIKEIWFVIHGWAQLAERYLSSFAALDDSTRFIIAPEALNKFYLKVGKPEVGATWMTREDRETEITDYVAYLNTLYDSFSLNDYNAKIVVLGFSQGVATVSRWMFKNPRKADTLIFYAGEPGNELQNPESTACFDKTKNYFIWGTEDPFINELNTPRFKTMLPGFEFISFAGKHEINTEVLAGLS
jgi:predicted esterase